MAGVQVDHDIYFSAWNMNGLFKYNPRTEEIKFLRNFSGEEDIGLHSEAILYHDSIWFIPRASERIAIVDLNNLHITYLDLPKDGYRSDEHIPPIRMKACYTKENNILWIFPFVYKLFLKIDMVEKKIIRVERNWKANRDAASLGIRIENKFWIYRNNNNEIQVLDIISEESEIVKLKNKKSSYLGIQNIGNWVVLFPRDWKDGILLLDICTCEMRMIELDAHGQWYYEYQACGEDGDILLVPYIGNKFIEINIDDGKCGIKILKNINIDKNAYCSTKMNYDNEIWFLSHVLENPIICYEKQTNKMLYRYMEIKQKKYNEDIIDCMERYGVEYSEIADKKVLSEQEIFLNTFIQYLKRKNYKNQNMSSKLTGDRIYNKLKSEF